MLTLLSVTGDRSFERPPTALAERAAAILLYGVDGANTLENYHDWLRTMPMEDVRQHQAIVEKWSAQYITLCDWTALGETFKFDYLIEDIRQLMERVMLERSAQETVY